MHVRKLSWAGVQLDVGGRRLLIDALSSDERLSSFIGKALWPLLPIPDWDGRTPVDALVTHRHADHYDPAALKRALSPGGRVYCPVEMVEEIENDGLNARGVAVWETVKPLGSTEVEITAVPSLDWRGDAQIAWVVSDGQARIFHGGDTIWHGSWWLIAQRFATFDMAFLPANGVVVHVPGAEPSGLPATLTPQQAVTAARLLHAAKLCPTHFGQFNNADSYREHDDVIGDLHRAATRQGVDLAIVEDGSQVVL